MVNNTKFTKYYYFLKKKMLVFSNGYKKTKENY